MIKVTIERNSIVQIYYINNAESLAQVNEVLLKEHLKESEEMRQSMERIDNRIRNMGYDSLPEALDVFEDMSTVSKELVETQENYEKVESIASDLGYDSVEDALETLSYMKEAFSDIEDIANRYT